MGDYVGRRKDSAVSLFFEHLSQLPQIPFIVVACCRAIGSCFPPYIFSPCLPIFFLSCQLLRLICFSNMCIGSYSEWFCDLAWSNDSSKEKLVHESIYFLLDSFAVESLDLLDASGFFISSLTFSPFPYFSSFFSCYRHFSTVWCLRMYEFL